MQQRCEQADDNENTAGQVQQLHRRDTDIGSKQVRRTLPRRSGIEIDLSISPTPSAGKREITNNTAISK